MIKAYLSAPLTIKVAIFLYAILLVLAILSTQSYLLFTAIGLPFLMLALFLAIYRPVLFAALLTLAIPLSINLKDIGMGFGLSLPGEILTFLLFGILLLNLFRGKYISKEILLHPVSIAILLNLVWMTISTFNSTMPLISIKFLAIRIAFILAYYLFLMQIFGTKMGIQKWASLYAISIIAVICFILYRHAQFGFVQQVNHYVTKPFFNDHTIYGAVLAMLLPVFAVNFILPSSDRFLPKALSAVVIFFLLTGIFFSYSRAVWLSLALLIPAALILLMKVKFKYVFGGILLLSFAAISVREPIIERMKSVESERGGDIKEHAASIANLNTSASNKERINRWESGLAMFWEKPLMGFGPGTYPFQYAPYQREENLTRISTNFGDQGGVHSEYLKPLSESGLPGFLSFLSIILLSIWTAFRLIYHSQDRTVKLLAAALFLGLLSYYIHGFVNFFLDTEKTSVLFWGMTGLIVALDIHHRSKTRSKIELLP